MADRAALDALVKGILEIEAVTISAVQHKFGVGYCMADKVIAALYADGALESVQCYRSAPAFDTSQLQFDKALMAELGDNRVDTIMHKDLPRVYAEKAAQCTAWRAAFVQRLSQFL